MKMNNKVRLMKSEFVSDYNCASERIYDCVKAEKNYTKSTKHGKARLFSMMKQENIRVALKDKQFSIYDFKEALENRCGYCFHQNENTDLPMFDDRCVSCILLNKVWKKCYQLKCYQLIQWNKMKESKTKATFSKHHKAWCKKLGIWNNKWE